MTPRALARRAERLERLAAARDRLAAEDAARRAAQRAKQEAWDAAVAAGKQRGGRRPGDEPRKNRAGTEPRANITDADVCVEQGAVGGGSSRERSGRAVPLGPPARSLQRT